LIRLYNGSVGITSAYLLPVKFLRTATAWFKDLAMVLLYTGVLEIASFMMPLKDR
jgi:hypothetical protein